MEKIKEKKDLENVKIIPLDESMYDNNVNNAHYNKVGALCELILDEILFKRLKEVLGKEYVYIESDFGYSVKDGFVTSLKLYFEFGRDYLKSDDNDKSEYVNALTSILNEQFKTDDVSLTPINDGLFAWIIDDKERMLWLIDRLNDLKLHTNDTLKVIER